MEEKNYRRARKMPSRRIQALKEAQMIAFAPMVFQAVRTMMQLGVLAEVHQGGCTRQKLAERLGRYGADLLVESGVTAGVLKEGEEGDLNLSEVGYCLVEDEMTQVNFNFVADVCYRGAEQLTESIRQSKPVGLKELGEWPTIYAGLSELKEPARTSWFAFDHLYSDAFFPRAIELMAEAGDLSNVFDIGGNTGKFARYLLSTVEDAQVTIVDLPGQVEMARAALGDAGGRCHFVGVNVLGDAPWPTGASAIWMSQFLDCFSHAQIVGILRKAAAALKPGGSIFISEPLLDKQIFPAAAFSLAQSSLYFTTMANGNSKFYTFAEMEECVQEAGLYVSQAWHGQGKYQYSLLQCRKAPTQQ